MLGVPAKHKTLDLLQFTASCHSGMAFNKSDICASS